jgi:hypothetical protein
LSASVASATNKQQALTTGEFASTLLMRDELQNVFIGCYELKTRVTEYVNWNGSQYIMGFKHSLTQFVQNATVFLYKAGQWLFDSNIIFIIIIVYLPTFQSLIIQNNTDYVIWWTTGEAEAHHS